MNEREAFKQALKKIGIDKHDVVLATVAMDGLTDYNLRADEYLNLLLETMAPEATLVMNCFTWKAFCENKTFNLQRTPSEVGLSSEIFRRMQGVIRSKNPIYSFCAKGPKAEELMKHEGETCWGKNTPFITLVEKNAFCVSLGKEFPRSITLLHSFEELKEVPNRFFKEFRGTADYGEGPREVSTKFFVRGDRSLTNDWTPAVKLLDERKQVRRDSKLPIAAVLAQNLQQACFELLDKDKNIFWVEKKSDGLQ